MIIVDISSALDCFLLLIIQGDNRSLAMNRKEIKKMEDAVNFAKTYQINPSNLESGWYIVWGEMLFHVVRDVDRCHLGPQLQITDFPEDVLSKFRRNPRSMIMLEGDGNVFSESIDPDSDVEMEVGDISFGSHATIPVNHWDKDTLTPDYAIIYIPSEPEKYRYLVLIELKRSDSRGELQEETDTEPGTQLALAITHVMDQVALSFQTQPDLVEVYGIAASGDRWVNRIFYRNEPIMAEKIGILSQLKELRKEIKGKKVTEDDMDYDPIQDDEEAWEKKEKEFQDEMEKSTEILMKTMAVLGSAQSAAQFQKIKEFISQVS